MLIVVVMPTGVAPSHRPSSSRRTISMTAVVVNPMAKVTSENSRMATDTIVRVPHFSMSRPAGICEIA